MIPTGPLPSILQPDLSAKVRWRMRFQRDPLFVTLQDKYKVRQFAAARGVKTPKLIHVTNEPETIPFDSLPRECIIKANNGCKRNILRFDGELYLFGDGSELVRPDGSFLNTDAPAHRLTRQRAVALCRDWLGQKYSPHEWAYHQITPMIVVEELLLEGNVVPDDYRLYTFHGAVRAIGVGSPLYREERENAFFDRNWNEFTLTRYGETRPDPIPARPARLGEMLQIAEHLGRDIDFVRIDLYDTHHGVLLGEMTVYPDAGVPVTPTACPVFNSWLGRQWKLSRADTVIAGMWNPVSRMKAYAAGVLNRCMLLARTAKHT